jgi:hypothetical protein
MKEAFLLPLTSRPYDANKRVFITNEMSVIAMRILPLKTFKDLLKDADDEGKTAFSLYLAAEAHADADSHMLEEGQKEAMANTRLNAWNGLTVQEQQGHIAPVAYTRVQFVAHIPSADEVAARTAVLRHGFLSEHLVHIFSTPAALGQLYAAPDSDNAATRLTAGHTAALLASKPMLMVALQKSAKIEAHSGAIAVLVLTIFDFWATVVQKNNADKLASAKIAANQAILARMIMAAAVQDLATDHCEAFEIIHQRNMAGFADLLAASVLMALEPAMQEHVKAKVGQEKMIKWARLSQADFVRKLTEQASLFQATQPTRSAVAVTGPALAVLQVEVATLRVENKRLVDCQQQQQQQRTRLPPAIKQQQQQPPPQQSQQQHKALSHPPGHPQYTGCAVRDANGQRCGAMDHGWRDHPS